jgi:hypothetical protein
VYAASSTGSVGVFLRGNADYRARFTKSRRTIDEKLGGPVSWIGDDDDWTIDVSNKADSSNKADWSAQHNWLAESLNKFLGVFAPYVDNNLRGK